MRRQIAALAVAVVGLLATWVGSEPGFGGPDEISHYLRGASIPEVGLEGEVVRGLDLSGYTPQQQVVVAQEFRRVRVGPGLSPGGRTCHLGVDAPSAACLDDLPPSDAGPSEQLTSVGTYPPATYVLPGFAAALARDPLDAVAAGSATSAVLCALLLLSGLVVLHRPGVGPLWLAGPIVALSPQVLYLGAALNPSGPEIAAGVALGSSLLRLARPASRPRGAIAVAAASACVLLLARSVSPAWVPAHLAVVGLLVGPRGLRRAVASQRGPLLGAGAAVGVAALLAAAWSISNGTDAAVGLVPLGAAVSDGVREAWIATTRHSVFAPGYLDIPVPGWITTVWRLMVFALVVAALVVATTRQRIALFGVCAAAFGAAALLQAALLRNTGFPVQGRHVLPLLVLVPLLAGDIVAERADQLPARLRAWLAASLAVPAACAHVGAWWVVARRAAVSMDGPWVFLGRQEWDPPLGWVAWALLLLLGAGGLVLAALPDRATAAPRSTPPAPG